MHYSLQPDGSLLFQEIDSFLASLLVVPFQQKELSSPIIDTYFFQKITQENPDFSKDWKEYVAPELQTLFMSCQEMVLQDLAPLREPHTPNHLYTLTIPSIHRDAWLRMLSMVRLSLASQHNIPSEELSEEYISSLSEAHKKALFQMEIFAVLQQCLIEAVLGEASPA